jgi:mannitol-1-phosphate 5-dehydrogenase
MRAVVIGAGNIGRGFLGHLLSKSNSTTTFIDVDQGVVEALNRLGRYPIHLIDGPTRTDWVENISATTPNTPQAIECLCQAEFLAISVGAKFLPSTAPWLAKAIDLRLNHGKSTDILLCENLANAAAHYRKALSQHTKNAAKIGLVETSIGRMVPIQERNQDLGIRVEAYAELPVNQSAFTGPIPHVFGLRPVNPFLPFIHRKLFIHNAGHAIAAYLGHQQSLTYIWECIENPEILTITRSAMQESAKALHREHALDPIELNEHIEDLLKRFANRALADQVSRVASDPVRKLHPQDRLLGAIRLCLNTKTQPEALGVGTIAALQFAFPHSSTRADQLFKLEQSLHTTIDPDIRALLLR